MSQVILIHYNEIGLKLGNRRLFEQQLQSNVQQILDDLFVVEGFSKAQVKWQYGRLYIENFVLTDWSLIKDRLQKSFGIANFVLAEKVGVDFEDIKQIIVGLLCRPWQSFRVTSKRAQKDFPLTSQQINEQLGEFIQQKTQARVDLENPDIIFYVEIVNKSAFVYTSQDGIVHGPGGLPIGVSGKAVCLLSGGIDSPVAAWLMMKRGLEVHFVHFHSAPQTDAASQDKVKRLVEILNQWQPSFCHSGNLFCHSRGGGTLNNDMVDSRLRGNDKHCYGDDRRCYKNNNLTMLPFLEFQQQIVVKTPAKYRVILYRREMLRQAEQIAKQINAQTIITGECLGQVASQTIENLGVIEKAITLPVLRPLIGFDKQEIITLAQKIGTYEISIEPHQDCCSLFVPNHPATKAKLAEILAIEKNLNLDS